jgi:hypothetical protein
VISAQYVKGQKGRSGTPLSLIPALSGK